MKTVSIFCFRYICVGVSLVVVCVLTLLAPFCRSITTIILALGPPEFFGAALGMGEMNPHTQLPFFNYLKEFSE